MLNYEIKEEKNYSDEEQICLGPLQVIYPLLTLNLLAGAKRADHLLFLAVFGYH